MFGLGVRLGVRLGVGVDSGAGGFGGVRVKSRVLPLVGVIIWVEIGAVGGIIVLVAVSCLVGKEVSVSVMDGDEQDPSMLVDSKTNKIVILWKAFIFAPFRSVPFYLITAVSLLQLLQMFAHPRQGISRCTYPQTSQSRYLWVVDKMFTVQSYQVVYLCLHCR